MVENEYIFYANRNLRRNAKWSAYYLQLAWNSLAKHQLKDELRYLNGVLGFNKLKILFENIAKNTDLGRRAKDLVYGFWNEEDIRLKLAAELYKFFPECQIHGQVHFIRSAMRMFPDLFILFPKQREVAQTKEKNLETAAIEIKHFTENCNTSTIKDHASKDLNKLCNYQKYSSPKTDCGFFFCVDETGKANEILRELFKKTKYRASALGYGIIVPRFAKQHLKYARFFESFESKFSRPVIYLLNCIIARLDKLKFGEMHEEKYGIYSRFHGKNQRGYIEIAWNKYVQGMRWPHLPIILRLYGDKHKLKCFPHYHWSYECDKWLKSEKLAGQAVISKINYCQLNSLKNIERYADDIASTIFKKL